MIGRSIGHLLRDALVAGGAQVHSYLFSDLLPYDVALGVDILHVRSTADWASHTAELPLVFGSTAAPEGAAIRAHWGAFVRGGGAPDRAGWTLPEWPAAGESPPGRQLVFNSSGGQEVRSFAAAVESCRLWNVIVAALLHCPVLARETTPVGTRIHKHSAFQRSFLFDQ
jgi:hypothetical protein